MKRLALLGLLCLPASLHSADEKPMTKAEERAKFHPRAVGMDARTRLLGCERRAAMEAISPLAALPFRNVGPEVQGGRIVDIEGPANRPDTLLVAFASGGLFRTENRGGSFTPLFDHESALTIGDVALGDADGRVIWVGTGENNSSRTSYAGTGVFRSTDFGKTWRDMGLHDTHHIGRVLVDAKSPDTVFVAAMGHLYTENSERGVFKSTDGGKTWRRTLFVDERTGAIDLVQNSKDPNVLFAAMWERDRKAWNFLESGPGSGIYRSTDRGETWKKLGGGFPEGDTVGRIGLAIAPAKPDVVYAVLDNQARRPESEPLDEEAPPGELTPRRLKALTPEQFAKLDPVALGRFLKAREFPKTLKASELIADVKSGKTKLQDVLDYLKDANRDLFESPIVGAEVYRSDDAGATWKRTHEGRLEKVFFTYGYYFARLAVAPDDPDRVYVAGFTILGSTDGGRTWTGLEQRGVHADQHVLHIDARSPRRVALGNDGGLNLSFDGGATWMKVNNLPVGQFTSVAVDDAEPYGIVGGLQDNGVMRGPSDYERGKSDPASWKSIYGGDGSCVQIDPKDKNRIYAAYQFGYASRLDLKTNEKTKIRPRPELKEKPLRYNWVSPFLVSPHSRDILYFGTNRLHRSFDRGDTWTPISGDLTSSRDQGDVPFGTITSIAESPKTFGVIFVGTDEGKVWGTRDGGATWRDLTRGLAKDRWVTRVVASSHDEGTVYAAQSGYRNDDFTAYLWRSTDFGATWASIADGLPAEPVNVVREDPKAKHLLYVGTDLGAFVSLDRGKSWNALTGGLPHVAVHDLQVQKEGDLVLGTHGRSVFVAKAEPLRTLTDDVQKEPLHAFPVEKTVWERRRGYGEHPFVRWNVRPPKVQIAWWSNASGETRITVSDAQGSAWRELTATSRPGLNVLDYDLTADPAKADAAEAALRKREDERAKAEEELEKKYQPARTAPAEEGDESVAKKTAKPVPAELAAALADPLLARRTRYLPAGTYTVEMRQGEKTSTTTLKVKPPKKDDAEDDDDAGLD